MGKRERVRARQLKKKMASGKLRRGAQFKKLARQQKRNEKRSAPKFTKPLKYDPEHRILIVGDGDFSFTAGLVAHRGGAGRGIVATSYDSEKLLKQKYAAAPQNILRACAAGVSVQHGIDATQLHTSSVKTKVITSLAESLRHGIPSSTSSGNSSSKNASKNRKRKAPAVAAAAATTTGGANGFDRVIFNFPHTGKQRVHTNRAMLSSFLRSAQEVLAPLGQIHVTIRMHPPYSLWGIPELAFSEGLVRECDDAFSISSWLPVRVHTVRTTDIVTQSHYRQHVNPCWCV